MTAQTLFMMPTDSICEVKTKISRKEAEKLPKKVYKSDGIGWLVVLGLTAL